MKTAALLSQALAADPHHHEALLLREKLFQTFVPRWHFPMLADTERNQAYARAIAATVRPGDIVLDIGCGAGLTAMLAARAGAKHVYTCEQQPLIAAAARQVIAQNGLSDRITVISKWSHEIVIGQDMPEPADVVVSEIVDTVLLGEGAMATLTHAMGALAKPGARAVPESGTLQAQLVQSDQLANQWQPPQAEGFDLRAFHHLANVAQITPNDLLHYEFKPLGSAIDLFDFNFMRPSLAHGHVSAALKSTNTGVAHAVLVSFEMDLAPGVRVKSGLASDGHWGCNAYLLDQPRLVSAGQSVEITAQHDSAQLSLSIHPERTQAADPKALWMSPDWQRTQHGGLAPSQPQWPAAEMPAQTPPVH
ncbi:methyltransferase domain-containing protein [Epibacterium sp. SM1979]|uniref:Methyltransferase domain-containing protein n=2 Tax=Tritonibacter litoralis TaxID=2662264 RepID=A0A843YMS8_9RHOB|nr:methyltransferase domain-containing protein [Tritonibacter litoralis]